jgi:hypothetical protein
MYGLADSRLAGSELGEVAELFVRREDAERALREVLADEQTWSRDVRVVEIEEALTDPRRPLTAH